MLLRKIFEVPKPSRNRPGPAASCTTRASIATWTGCRVNGEMIPQPIVSRLVSRATSAETTVDERASIPCLRHHGYASASQIVSRPASSMTRALASISSSGSIVSCMTPMRNGTATRLTSSLSPVVARLKPYTSLTCHGRPAPAVTSADARQRVADQHVDDPRPAERRVEYDEALRLVADLADECRVGAERVRAQGREGGTGRLGGDDGDQPALAGDVERIDAENLAGRGDRGTHGERLLGERNGEASLGGELVERGREPAAGRVTHPAQTVAEGDERRGELVDGRRVAREVDLEREI